jgi:hypothetical protein
MGKRTKGTTGGLARVEFPYIRAWLVGGDVHKLFNDNSLPPITHSMFTCSRLEPSALVDLGKMAEEEEETCLAGPRAHLVECHDN